ncbi:hypothetical protein [Streptomyces buecherae]|uniref:hypothetical protein n=1 Tax=Streptomyces buecherae TaxID=2763006 RepID=UPI0036A7CD0C
MLALVGTGYFGFGGGYARYKSDQLLGNACDGVLAKREARAVLGDGPLKKGDDGNDSVGTFAGRETDERSLRVRCSIRRDPEDDTGMASVAVTVSGVPARGAADSPFRELYAGMPYGLAPAPLGHGWSGIFAMEDDGHRGGTEAMTSVVLDCADTPSDLLVTARVGLDAITLDNADHRADFARVATATASKAARHWDCDARLGKDPTSVGLPVNEEEYVPVRDASGTCAGVPAARPAHGRIAVSRAWESARGTAPYEACVLGGEEVAHGRYRLRAVYGPYAEELRYVVENGSGIGPGAPDFDRERAGRSEVPQLQFWWGTAECGEGRQRPLYTAEKIEGTLTDRERELSEDPAYERRALAEFARRSAVSHGCTAPTTP